MAKKGDKLARLVNIPIIASKIKDISSEAVTIAAGAAGTVKTFQLNYSPILDSNKEYIGGYGDSSLSFATGVFDVEVESQTADADLANGEYWIDYITGHGRGKKKTTGTSESVSYSVREEASQFADPMVYMGVIACAANPNYPAADGGYVYVVSTAGKIGGASGPNVEVGDMLICKTDGTAAGDHATVGAQWDIIQVNIDGAVTGPASATDNAIAQFNGTTGKIIEDSTIVVGGGANTFTFTKGTAVLDIAASSNVNIDGNLAVEAASAINQDVTSDASPTFTAVNATTFDTNIVAAGVTLAGTTLSADGTDVDINIAITPKGAGEVDITKIDVNGGTIDGCTIATSDITVGAGKTLDVSAGTLTLADNQISGDKVEGGTIAATTITTLTSTTVYGATFDTNVAAAGVTLTGTTLAADGTDANIDINITPKGTGDVVIGAFDLSITGSIASTGSRVAKGWFTDLEVTNAIAGSVTGNAGTVTNGVYTSSQVTVLAAADAADKDKYLHANASTGVLEWVTIASGTPTAITVADESSDTTCFPLFVTAATGDLGPKTNSGLSFNSSSGLLTATGFSGPLTGDVTGNCSGTAATVTGATQANITTCANLTTVGTIGTGVWQGTTVKANYLQQAAADLGAADVELNFSNSNGSYITNLTIDGSFIGNGITIGGLITKESSESVADDGTITLATGVSGELSVWDGTNYGIWFVKTDGTCILGPSQGLCDDADTDGCLCVYDGGSGAVIKNRTGGQTTVRYIYNYS